MTDTVSGMGDVKGMVNGAVRGARSFAVEENITVTSAGTMKIICIF